MAQLRHILAILLVLAIVVVQAPPTAHAADGPVAVLIMDGSGSMWGRLDGEKTAKVQAVRDGVRKALGDSQVARTTRFGLAAFGDRRGGDCSDAHQSLAPTRNTDEMFAALDKVNPRGRGPLVLALRDTAKSLAGVPGPRAMILVHDDPDNCDQDPCAAAAEIAKADPGLVIHTISIGLKKADAQRMACVAAATHGRAYEANSAADISAAVVAAFTESGRGAAPPSAPVARARAVAPAASVPLATVPVTGPAPLTGPPALYPTLYLGAEKTPLARPIDWLIAAEGAPDVPLYRGRDAEPALALPAGRYTVIARDGVIEGRQTIAYDAKAPTRVDVRVDAGLVTLGTGGGQPAAAHRDATIAVFNADAKGSAGAIVTIVPGDLGDMLLPPGAYVIEARDGQLRVSRPVTVTAGRQPSTDLALATARLQLTANASERGRTTSPTVFLILEDDPDAPKGRREVVRSAHAAPVFTLPAGTYYAVARSGTAEVRERIALAAGDQIKRTLTPATTRLSLSARLAGSGRAIDGPVTYRIERIDTVPPEVLTSREALNDLDVAAGRYRIEARAGNANAFGTEDVDLRAGEQRAVRIELKAGVAEFRVKGAATPDTAWRITDTDGRVVLGGMGVEQRALLQAGRYSVRAEQGDRRVEGIIDLRAGETRTFAIGP